MVSSKKEVRSKLSSNAGMKRQERKREQEAQRTKTLDNHTSLVFIPQARVEAFHDYYKYGMSTMDSVNTPIRCPYLTLFTLSNGAWGRIIA
jgi:hypothetical protein